MSKRIPPVLARLAVLCLLCLAFTSHAALAQSQATTGDIEGRVLDPLGAVITGAAVTAKNRATGFERTVNTDEDGNYRFVLLPPGSYSVEVFITGFRKAAANDVQVTVGSKTSLDLNLAVAGISETTIIVAEPPTVETTRTSVSTTINERSIQNLPINGRNFQDFATLSPGVIRDPRGGDLSVGGQRGTLNSLQVDGVDNNNTFFGQALGRGGVRPPYQFSEESVQEFQVNQNGFSAEFGRAGGAVINVVTKSGTNVFHGGLFEYLRDESLNANDPGTKATQARLGRPEQAPALAHQPVRRTRRRPHRQGQGVLLLLLRRPALGRPAGAGRLEHRVGARARAGATAAAARHLSGRAQPGRLPRQGRHLAQPAQPANACATTIRASRAATTRTTGRSRPKSTRATASSRATPSAAASPHVLTKTVVNEFRFQLARDKEPGEANS